MSQPIIRGIQAVGAVDIFYTYNGPGNVLTAPHIQGVSDVVADNIPVAGFRLDGEFLRAMQQIASSATIPILGGGGVSLTNNNRTGTLSLTCTKVSTPVSSGEMYSGQGIGPIGDDKVYDMVLLAQLQQGQEGGDAYGATVKVVFKFSGKETTVTFDGCTIASVDPLGLAGNDAVTYNVTLNYLNWTCKYSN
jgi:hypothetical protein